MKLGGLTERDLETLRALDAACRNYQQIGAGDWVRPLDCGAWNGSHHSATLNKLACRGLVEVRSRGGWTRGSKKYRITETGRARHRREQKAASK